MLAVRVRILVWLTLSDVEHGRGAGIAGRSLMLRTVGQAVGRVVRAGAGRRAGRGRRRRLLFDGGRRRQLVRVVVGRHRILRVLVHGRTRLGLVGRVQLAVQRLTSSS